MRRAPTGKWLAPTARDLAIFEVLTNFRYLNSAYLHAFVGGRSEKRFIERLGLLFHEGYLARPEGQWTLPDARRRPALYEIGAPNGSAGEARTFLGPNADKQLEHSALLCAVLASFEIACREPCGPRFISWPEILARAPSETRSDAHPFKLNAPSGESVIPDGIFGLEYGEPGGRSYRFFALEVDRGTMPVTRTSTGQTSLMEKFKRYEAFVVSGGPRRQLGVSSFIVLSVTTSEARLAQTIRRAGEALSQPGRFLLAAVPERALDAPYRDLLFAPWRRANLPPVSLVSGTSTHPPKGG